LGDGVDFNWQLGFGIILYFREKYFDFKKNICPWPPARSDYGKKPSVFA